MAFLIIAIVLVVDHILNRNPKPKNTPANFAQHKNKYNREEEERAEELAQQVPIEAVHSISWDVKTRQVETIEYIEI